MLINRTQKRKKKECILDFYSFIPAVLSHIMRNNQGELTRAGLSQIVPKQLPLPQSNHWLWIFLDQMNWNSSEKIKIERKDLKLNQPKTARESQWYTSKCSI
jgi:hypothetical protein